MFTVKSNYTSQDNEGSGQRSMLEYSYGSEMRNMYEIEMWNIVPP